MRSDSRENDGARIKAQFSQSGNITSHLSSSEPTLAALVRNRIWIKNPLAVFDSTTALTNDIAGGVVVAGNQIVERVPANGAPTEGCDETFDASDCVLLPGLINTHHHFYQTLTRAHSSGLNQPLFNWLQGLYPIWRHLTPELIQVSTELASAELLLSGCTTAVDHHYVFSDKLSNAIDVQAETTRQMGIRAVLTRGSMSLGTDDGGLPPQTVVQSDDAILADSERLVSRWHDSAADAMTQIALAPCSPFSVTPELLKQTASLAKANGVGLHTHLAETADENDYCLNAFGVRPLEHLANNGWLTPATWLAHGIHFDAGEIQLLADTGVSVAHCPSSNMMLGSGICRVQELRKAGVAVGLAVDGSASNDHSNLIQEVRECALLQRLRNGLDGTEGLQQTPLFAAEDALRIATSGGAAVLNRPLLGSLAVNAMADLALFRLTEPRFSGAQNPLAALVLGGAHQADHVMVNGQWRVLNQELLGVDLHALLNRHRAAAKSLWEQV